MSLDDVIRDLKSYLEYERDEGALQAPVSPDVLESLSGDPAPSPIKSAAPAKAVPAQEFDLLVATKVDSAPAEPVAPPSGDTLKRIANEISTCSRCPLHEGRTLTVPGQGCASPEIVFVGEGPGADEDREGLAFVGKAGQLLTKMILAMGLTRDEVFICNVVKCRPPDNRKPEITEMAACLPYLERQINLLSPKVIIAMGATALNGLVKLPKGMGITRARGTWMRFSGIDLMPTFHPAYLLRNPNMKKYVWEDLQTVLKKLDKPIPEVRKR